MNNGPKTLHIIDSLGLGGAQTVVKGILEYQPENKSIFLFALRKRDITTEIKQSNVRIFNSTRKYSLSPLFELRNLIRKEKIDILHCHLFRSQVFGWLLKVIWFRNIRLIFHEHGEIFQCHFLYDFFMRLSKRQVNRIIAVSNTTQSELIKKAGIQERKIVVLPNFVDLNKFNRNNINWNLEEEKEKLGIKKDEFVIGFVGRLEKVKGCEYLIKSLPYLNFPYKVLVAGDGSEREDLEILAKTLGIDDKVIFLGYRDNVVLIYPLLDILVVPSLSESLGLSVIEAQAMSVPVIASNIGGLGELVINKKNGILFESKNYVNLAEKIVLLKKDIVLKEVMIKNAYNDIRKYCLENYMKSLIKNYGN
ncbi:MAG: glycosyltransferase family 4 protein [Bacteroidota bacterium]